MAKRRKNGQMSDEELEVRRHHASLRRLKSHCSNSNVVLKNYESADPDDMCVFIIRRCRFGIKEELFNNR